MYSRDDLLAHASRRTLDRLLNSGVLLRLRRGHYASRAMPLDVQRAIAIGGRVSCVSALGLQGFWVPPGCGLHIEVEPHASRLRTRRGSASDLRVHWVSSSSDASIATVEEAVVRVLRCQPRREAIAVIDSILHSGRLSVDELEMLMRAVPGASRIDLADVDPRAESGVESLVRVALRDAGLLVQSQIVIPDVGRVDLLVEGRVIVEVDGRAWHHNQQARDYRRDLEAAAQGYATVRVDYAHATLHEQIVVAAVRRAARTGPDQPHPARVRPAPEFPQGARGYLPA